MIDVVRKTCEAGQTTVFAMKGAAVSFLVKNFTSGNLLVCLEDEWDDVQTVMIAAGTGEVVATNLSEGVHSTADTVLAKASVNGTVEVIRND